MTSNPSNFSIDPDGETRPILPEDDPSYNNQPGSPDPNATTMAYLPESDPALYQQSGQNDPNAPTTAYLPGQALPYSPGQQQLFIDPYATQPLPYQQPYQPGQPGLTQPYQPQDQLSIYQPIRVAKGRQKPQRSQRRRGGFGCFATGCLGVVLVFFLLAIYLFAPLRTNLLLLGLDRAPEGTSLSRTDTMILMSVNPLLPDIKMLSIPRDLWVSIPGGGENRINTVHFFAEGVKPGSGPRTTLQVVRDTFNVPVSYYIRVRFDGVVGIVDAMGGVDVDLSEAMSGYEAGLNHLDGNQALAFARDRKGTDDFFRMARGQILIKAMVKSLLSPVTWTRTPQIITAVFQMVETNLPIWEWPRVGIALVRGVLFGGIDNRTFDRQMATPFTTDGGAQVLIPQWDLIQPVVREMFGA